jgi:hypothetical protein
MQSTCFECLQIGRTAQDSQNVEVSQRDDNQDCGLYQPPTCRQQGNAPIDRLEDHVKSSDQGDIDSEDGEIAGDAKAKKPFVPHNVHRRLRGIVEDDQMASDIELGEDRREERKEIRESNNFRCFAL